MLRRLRNWFRSVFARYEGATTWSSSRSWIPGAVTDARIDISVATRTELVRKSRYFEKNNAFVNRLADLFEQFTVGPQGMPMIPASSDPEWNSRAQQAWDTWCHFPDMTSLQTFATLQGLIARAAFVDGEVFILKTRGDSGRPRIQVIEAHRICTPPDLRSEEGKSIIDGIKVNNVGRPVGYYVSEGTGTDMTFRLLPAESVIHHFEPGRAGQYRGIPLVSAVLNDINDLDDLQMLEMRAAKDAAEVSNVITSETGEMTTDGLLRSRFQVSNTDGQGNSVTQDTTEFVRNTIGGRTVALKRGEKLEQFRSERPSVASQQYWDYLTSKICAGVGISKMLVLPYSLQGTAVRAELDIANTFFRSRSAVLADTFKRIYAYVMGWSVANEAGLRDKPGDWWKVTTRPPRAVNVDVGRNSSALIGELDAGVRTYEDVYAEVGQDWKQAFRQRAVERTFVKQLAAEFGLEPDEIVKASNAELMAQQQSTQQSNEVV